MKKCEQWTICYSGEHEKFPEVNTYLHQGKIIISSKGQDSYRLICMQKVNFYKRKLNHLMLVSGTSTEDIISFLDTKPKYVFVMVFSDEDKAKIKEKHDVEVIVLYNGCRYILETLFMAYKNGWVKFHVKKLSDSPVPVKKKPVKVAAVKTEKKNVDVDVQKSSDDKKAN